MLHPIMEVYHDVVTGVPMEPSNLGDVSMVDVDFPLSETHIKHE